MTEIDVAVTDYLLCLETAWFVFGLLRLGVRARLAGYFLLAFAGLSIASFLGGTSHGFFNDPASPYHFSFWWMTLVAIGAAAAGFGLAGYSLLGLRFIQHINIIIFVVLAAYTFTTYIYPLFLVAILFYLPAILLCLAGFIKWNRLHPGQGAHYGIYGIILSLVASLVQQLDISLHPVYLTHNAVYHIIMMVALLLVYVGMRRILLYEKKEI